MKLALQIGTHVMWEGAKCLVVGAHGYPVKAVDLRWTREGVSGSRDEVSGHKRNVPVSELEPLPS